MPENNDPNTQAPAPVPAPQPEAQPAPQPASQPTPQPAPNYVYTQQPVQQMYPGAKPTKYKKERIAAAILALSPIGTFGAHKFYNGYTTEGIIMIVIAIVGSCLFGLGALVALVISIVEGVTYLTKSDEEWERTYVYAKKGWF